MANGKVRKLWSDVCFRSFGGGAVTGHEHVQGVAVT